MKFRSASLFTPKTPHVSVWFWGKIYFPFSFSPCPVSLPGHRKKPGEVMPLSQFGQALKELGITHIKATTPQAKGRIERLFQTLQDRLLVELRIRGVNTLEEANRILPELI
ncbi:MAG: hypothetical protein IMX04_08220 [Candidatus Carbobacillus altaicus]|nr:hypothetical protein [Candidatus Carbobacillus altaicus]